MNLVKQLSVIAAASTLTLSAAIADDGYGLLASGTVHYTAAVIANQQLELPDQVLFVIKDLEGVSGSSCGWGMIANVQSKTNAGKIMDALIIAASTSQQKISVKYDSINDGMGDTRPPGCYVDTFSLE